eukprot:9928469-Lingulodinium_polyedra.AAC.1
MVLSPPEGFSRSAMSTWSVLEGKMAQLSPCAYMSPKKPERSSSMPMCRGWMESWPMEVLSESLHPAARNASGAGGG